MTLIPPMNQLDGDKLEALRLLDQHRQWHSLDEKRYCIVCGNIITGRDIRVTGDPRDNGSARAACPTDGCPSIPMDWVRPTDEVMANQVESSAGGQVESAGFNRAG